MKNKLMYINKIFDKKILFYGIYCNICYLILFNINFKSKFNSILFFLSVNSCKKLIIQNNIINLVNISFIN